VYLGVAAERIVANPGTITGSIGVILRGNDLSRLLERIGVRFDTVKSGLYKDILSPDRALSEGERELLDEEDPADDSPEARARNRRVAVIIQAEPEPGQARLPRPPTPAPASSNPVR
jgi:ClpP class serine protease